MAEDKETWFSYFGMLYNTMSATQKKELDKFLSVQKGTVAQWIRGPVTPRANNIAGLLAFLQEDEREKLRSLLLKDLKTHAILKGIGQDVSPLSIKNKEDLSLTAYFYKTLLRLERDTSDVFWSISSYIFNELLLHLDPENQGMKITLALCMPPWEEDNKIHSLREFVSMATGSLLEQGPRIGDLQTQQTFLGQETLAGYAVMQQIIDIFITDREEQTVFPQEHDTLIRGRAVFLLHRIRREGLMIAGALILTSITPLPTRYQEVFIDYADALRLALDPSWYFSSSCIDLATFPSREHQRPYFTNFHRRVAEAQISLHSKGSLSLSDAELHVRKEIEKTLVR